MNEIDARKIEGYSPVSKYDFDVRLLRAKNITPIFVELVSRFHLAGQSTATVTFKKHFDEIPYDTDDIKILRSRIIAALDSVEYAICERLPESEWVKCTDLLVGNGEPPNGTRVETAEA